MRIIIAITMVVSWVVSCAICTSQRSKIHEELEEKDLEQLESAASNVDCGIFAGYVIEVDKKDSRKNPDTCVVSIECIFKKIFRDVEKDEGFWFIPTYLKRPDGIGQRIEEGKRYIFAVNIGRGARYPTFPTITYAKEIGGRVNERIKGEIDEIVHTKGVYGNGSFHHISLIMRRYRTFGICVPIGEKCVNLMKYGIDVRKRCAPLKENVKWCVIHVEGMILEKSEVRIRILKTLGKEYRGNDEEKIVAKWSLVRKQDFGRKLYMAEIIERDNKNEIGRCIPVLGIDGECVKRVERWLKNR